MAYTSYWGQGPPQKWQAHPSQRCGDISPIRRLHLMGQKGLPVGKGTRKFGGLTELSALRLEWSGVADLVYNDQGDIIRVIPRQLSFIFW